METSIKIYKLFIYNINRNVIFRNVYIFQLTNIFFGISYRGLYV